MKEFEFKSEKKKLSWTEAEQP